MLQDYRINRLREAAEKVGYDCLIASCAENIAYISGGYVSIAQSVSASTQLYAVLNVKTGSLSYVCSVAEVPHLLEFIGTDSSAVIYPYGPFHFEFAKRKSIFTEKVSAIISGRFDNGQSALVAAVRENGSTPGFDETHINFKLASEIAALLNVSSLSPASSVFREARRIKHEAEIKGLRASARIAEQSLLEALECAAPGITEKDLENSFRQAVTRRGGIPYFFVATAAHRSAYVDACNTPLVINKGDVIRFDFGCIYDGYYSDLARTAVMHYATEDTKKAYRAVQLGAKAALKAIKPGISAEAVFDIAVEATRKNGISSYERSHCGHGIGLEGYDVPSITSGNDDLIQKNMVLCIETPYYCVGWGGVQIEHTIAITDDGFEFLDSGDSSLIIIPDGTDTAVS